MVFYISIFQVRMIHMDITKLSKALHLLHHFHLEDPVYQNIPLKSIQCIISGIKSDSNINNAKTLFTGCGIRASSGKRPAPPAKQRDPALCFALQLPGPLERTPEGVLRPHTAAQELTRVSLVLFEIQI